MLDEIITCEQFTNLKLATIRSKLQDSLSNTNYAIVTSGSYARGEASEQSDLDYFVICDGDKTAANRDLPGIAKTLRDIVTKGHAPDGAFGQVDPIEVMTQNIGGDLDGNAKITRRVLFLLEGEWLYNQNRFNEYRDQVIKKYIKESISDHQFCRFLLNDFIRYYRTICVDFEHKTQEQGKSWGSRNIKLIFSRKLLYFSGILVTAETWQHTYKVKLERIRNLLALTPARRVRAICGTRADPVLNAYGEFLRKMRDPSVRTMLDKTSETRSDQSAEFRTFKNEGHHFTWMLAKLLRDTYDSSHPIHNALIA